MAEVSAEMRRHSAAHLMARAIMNLFEDVQVDIGPATDEGFYYDFDLPHRLSPEDFPMIEAEIARLIALDEPFVRKEVTADEAKKLLAGQKYKLERLATPSATTSARRSSLYFCPARSSFASSADTSFLTNGSSRAMRRAISVSIFGKSYVEMRCGRSKS